MGAANVGVAISGNRLKGSYFARRYIFSDGPVDGLDDFVEREHPQAQLSSQASVRRFDLMAEAYRIMPHEVVGE